MEIHCKQWSMGVCVYVCLCRIFLRIENFPFSEFRSILSWYSKNSTISAKTPNAWADRNKSTNQTEPEYGSILGNDYDYMQIPNAEWIVNIVICDIQTTRKCSSFFFLLKRDVVGIFSSRFWFSIVCAVVVCSRNSHQIYSAHEMIRCTRGWMNGKRMKKTTPSHTHRMNWLIYRWMHRNGTIVHRNTRFINSSEYNGVALEKWKRMWQRWKLSAKSNAECSGRMSTRRCFIL